MHGVYFKYGLGLVIFCVTEDYFESRNQIYTSNVLELTPRVRQLEDPLLASLACSATACHWSNAL